MSSHDAHYRAEQTTPVRILYFVPELDAVRSGVLHSQVIGQISAVTSAGFHTMFVGSTAESVDSPACKELAEHASEVHLFPKTIAGGFYSATNGANAIAEFVVQQNLQADFIYIRSVTSYLGARRLQRSTKARLVYDCRGLLSHEHSMGRGFRRQLEKVVLQAIEVHVIKQADKVLAVTSFLADWIKARTNKEVTVVPCCVPSAAIEPNFTTRGMVRAQLGIPHDAPVIIYSGGTSRWQRIDDIVKIFTEAQRLDERIHAIYLTPDVEVVTKLLVGESSYPTRTIITKAPQQEVMNYLRSADVGILLRERSIVNRCASPIKAAEYLAAGLTLAISPEIGDISTVVMENDVGIELSYCNATAARQLVDLFSGKGRKDSPAKSIEVVKEKYIWDAYINRYQDVFSLSRQLL